MTLLMMIPSYHSLLIYFIRVMYYKTTTAISPFMRECLPNKQRLLSNLFLG